MADSADDARFMLHLGYRLYMMIFVVALINCIIASMFVFWLTYIPLIAILFKSSRSVPPRLIFMKRLWEETDFDEEHTVHYSSEITNGLYKTWSRKESTAGSSFGSLLLMFIATVIIPAAVYVYMPIGMWQYVQNTQRIHHDILQETHPPQYIMFALPILFLFGISISYRLFSVFMATLFNALFNVIQVVFYLPVLIVRALFR